MAKRRTTEQSEKLAKLREKMKGVVVGESQGFWNPKEGTNIIRILPPVGEMEFFFQEVAQYKFGGKKFFSPEFTTDGEYPCPIRDLVRELYKGAEEDKLLAKKLNSWPLYTRKYWMNIAVRDKDDDGGDTGSGPFIFAPGPTIFRSLMVLIEDDDYADITDEEHGVDIIIKRKGLKKKTEYDVNPRRYDCPLHQDEAVMDKWLDEAADLSWVHLSDDPAEDKDLGEGAVVKVLPYDRIVDEIGIGPDSAIETIESALEEKKEDTSDGNGKFRKKMKAKKEAKAEVAEDEVGEVLQQAKQRRQRRRRK